MLDKLNDKGRDIQEKQGGPRPSYNADGGQIQYASGGYSIPNPMVSEKMIIEAYDKYLKGFNIDLPNPNMALNYDDFKESVLAHNAIKFDQGGQVPKYAADGDLVIDDRFLDSVQKVETGNNPNQTSSKGAAGPFQITADTALNPGYDVNPISLEDRFNPVIARNFAKEYFKGIKKYHPTFNRDEVITAFHSGAGNVMKAKAGVEDLGPVGQAYAGKVMNIMYDGKPPPQYPNTQAYGNRNEEENNTDIFKTIMDAPGDLFSYLKEGFKEAQIIGNKSSLEKTKKRRLKAAEDSVEYYTKQFEENRTQRNKELLEGAIKYRDEQQTVVTDAKTKIKEMVDVKKEKQDALENIDVKNLPKQDVGAINSDLNNILTNIVTETTSQPVVKETEEALVTEGKKKADSDPKFFNEVKSYLSQFFNTRELTRAALIYTGSRLLGYNHGSTLNVVSKSYLSRMDAQMNANQKWALSKDATENFTQSSIQDWLNTGDRNKLIGTGSSITGPDEPMFDSITQQIIQMVKLKGGGTGARLRNSKGNYVVVPYAQVADRLSKVDPKIHDPGTIKENFFKFSTAAQKDVNKGVEEEDQIGETKIKTIADQAYHLLNDTMKDNKFRKDRASRARTMSKLNIAMKNYYEALKSYKQGDGKQTTEPKSLGEFFNKEMITFRTGGSWTPELLELKLILMYFNQFKMS
jgi:hypothetical protein